jgi:hypothetical protein
MKEDFLSGREGLLSCRSACTEWINFTEIKSPPLTQRRNVCPTRKHMKEYYLSGRGRVIILPAFGCKDHSPNYIFPSPDPLGTNKVVGACWRNLRGAICANIFAVPRPPWLSPEGPIYIFPSPDPLGTNKMVGACWRNLRGAICANIFAVPRLPWLSSKGDQCWRNLPITWSVKINVAGLERTTLCNSASK